jgi:hypothetical protein
MPSDGATPSHAESDPSPQSDFDKSRQEPPRGPDALADAVERLAEAREYIAHLIAAEFERLKLRFRRATIWAIAGLTAVVLLLAIIVAAAGLLLFGLSQLVGSLLGDRPWLGGIIVGGGVLVLGILLLAWGLWSWQASAFNAARERFAARKRRQEARFGRSVDSAEEDRVED